MDTTEKRIIPEDDDVIQYEQTLEKPTTYLDGYRYPVLESSLPDEQNVKTEHEDSKRKLDSTSKFKIPFDFYFNPKAYGLSVQETLDELRKKPVDNTMFTRPRIYKCPEVSLDDIPDKKMREMIINFIYTSESHNAMEETMNAITNSKDDHNDSDCVDTSLYVTDKERLLNNIKARKLICSRMEPTSGEIKPANWESFTGKEWDHTQPKFVGKPTINFWAKKAIHGPDYDPTNIPVTKEYKEYITELLKKDRVRFPHTYTHYKGFKPQCSHKIALEKQKPDPFDFWYTTNQYYGKHYIQNNEKKNEC